MSKTAAVAFAPLVAFDGCVKLTAVGCLFAQA